MTLSLKDLQKVKPAELKTVEVEVSEWGGNALLRELTGLDFDEFQGMAIDPDTREVSMAKLVQRRGRLIQLSIYDSGTGRRMFDTEKLYLEYIKPLSRKSFDALANAAFELNGLNAGNDES